MPTGPSRCGLLRKLCRVESSDHLGHCMLATRLNSLPCCMHSMPAAVDIVPFVTLQALAAALAPKAKALRDGKVETVDATNLVPGDVIIMKFGDIVPADVKILSEGDDVDTADETPMQVRR